MTVSVSLMRDASTARTSTCLRCQIDDLELAAVRLRVAYQILDSGGDFVVDRRFAALAAHLSGHTSHDDESLPQVGLVSRGPDFATRILRATLRQAARVFRPEYLRRTIALPRVTRTVTVSPFGSSRVWSSAV